MIRKNPDFNVYVVSVERCSSSVMMQMVQELGVDMVYGSENQNQVLQRMLHSNQRFGDYVQNDRFLEIGRKGWPAAEKWMLEESYRGCKMILPSCLSGKAWSLITAKPSKVIMMWREPEDIVDSHYRVYGHLRGANFRGEDPEEQRKLDVLAAGSRLAHAKNQFEERRKLAAAVRFTGHEEQVQPFDYMVVPVDRLSESRDSLIATVNEIAEFIRAPRNIWNALDCYDPDLVRCRGNVKHTPMWLNPNDNPRDMAGMCVIQLPNAPDVEDDEDQGREQVMHVKLAQLAVAGQRKSRENVASTIEKIEKARTKVRRDNKRRKKQATEVFYRGRDGDDVKIRLDDADRVLSRYRENIERMDERIATFDRAIAKVMEA
ncbi:MAG: hypothetical protein HN919_18570 [Verrucomicrobia bacterium]|nr:hypothetical protein [Verrucomicrobiota bacterium]